MKPFWILTFLCLAQLCQAGPPRLNPKAQPAEQDDGYAYADDVEEATEAVVTELVESASVSVPAPEATVEAEVPISDPFEFAKKENLPVLLSALRKMDFGNFSAPDLLAYRERSLNKKERRLMKELTAVVDAAQDQKAVFESDLKTAFTSSANEFVDQLEQVVPVPIQISRNTAYRIASPPENAQRFAEAKKILATTFLELFLVRPEPPAPRPYKPSRYDSGPLRDPGIITNAIFYTVFVSIGLVDMLANMALAHTILDHTVGYIDDWRVQGVAQSALAVGLMIGEPVALIMSLWKLSDALTDRAKKRRMHEALAAFRSTLVSRGIPVPADSKELESDPLKLFSWLNKYLELRRRAAGCEGLL